MIWIVTPVIVSIVSLVQVKEEDISFHLGVQTQTQREINWKTPKNKTRQDCVFLLGFVDLNCWWKSERANANSV